MAQNQLSNQNILGAPLREDEVSQERQLQIIPPSSRPPTFEHGFLHFSELNDQDFLRRVSMDSQNHLSVLAHAIVGGAAYGLKLEKTELLAELIERRLCAANHGKKEKLKAAHFPIKCLEIGQFRVEALHEAHLVAKWYYAKRKLAWEILYGGLKKKIEVSWHDISNIRAILPQGRLEIMLQDRPSFYLEVGPTPKKHTKWTPWEDFTGYEASTIRKHSLLFKPGVLDMHYSKLLQCDENLRRLSSQPFPELERPLFTSFHNQRTTNPSYNNYTNTSGLNMNQASPSTQVPLLLVSTEQVQQFRSHNSTSSSMDIISFETEAIKKNNQALQDSRPVVSHGGYADPISRAGKQPLVASTPSPQKVHQFRDLITLPSSSVAISLSTSPALDTCMAATEVFSNNQSFQDSQQAVWRGPLVYEYADLLAKISMPSANQLQPSSSTAAPMPSTQQVQQFGHPYPLPSSFGINDLTMVFNNNQMLQDSENGGLLHLFANFTTDNSLSSPNASDPELLNIETYLHSEISRQTLCQKAAVINSSAPTFAAPPMQLQDPATYASIINNTQFDDSSMEVTYEDLFPDDGDANLQQTNGEVYVQPTTPHFNTDAQSPNEKKGSQYGLESLPPKIVPSRPAN